MNDEDAKRTRHLRPQSSYVISGGVDDIRFVKTPVSRAPPVL